MIFDLPIAPRVEVTQADGMFTAKVSVDGLAATRDPTTIERAEGIVSLDPIEVTARTTRQLIERSQYAVGVAQYSMTGEVGGPVGLLFTYFRTALAVRGALRKLDEDLI